MLERKAFMAASIGTLIEYYDYALFALFLPILSPIFFPSSDHYDSLIKGYIALLIAMIARPIGGIVFGIIGDRMGRRDALMLSIIGIGVSTLMLAAVPSFATIGIAAPILIVLCKTAQVFCFGGEYNGAGIYVVEHTKERQAFWGSLLTATTLCGSLLATLMGIVATLPSMPTWSWRIAFAFGGVMAIGGLYYRRLLTESPAFTPSLPKQFPFRDIFKKYPRGLLAGFFIGGMATVPFTTVLTFVNPVLTTQHFMTNHQLMLLQSCLIVVCILTLVAAGRLADRYSPSRVMRIGGLLLAVAAFPALLGIDQHCFICIVIGQVVLLIINEILLGPSNAYLKNAFEGPYRYRAASFSFTLGMSILGGATPLIEHALYKATGHFSAIAIWLVAVGLATFFTIAAQSNVAIRNLPPLSRPPLMRQARGPH